ncbi:MAG: carbon starvation protein A [Leptotrichiaceae bacterium]|nr:carbon starvation protein A [Leptotrichiaceae bacterium]MBP6281456.1 carbon starvation protein A [Leptotrichiaceae bacterium]MBP7100506.1 carbon starvation protein A [Leptotrichiaceae bacterium]MBP9629827.1 carbon starvation protein A [Leptotrichiaceae bacterium]
MISFVLSIVALILGYLIYGKIVEKIFVIEPNRPTPAIEYKDGVDYVELSTSRSFLIQFLNIAGTGPIFGAIAGALWGPSAFLWIVFGCIFGGATHDFLIGMLSLRSKGSSIGELVGENLGFTMQQIMRVFSIVLLLLVGVVFIKSPADILHNLMPNISAMTFIIIIILYYILATVLPIDRIIAKIYPIFGFALLFMAIGIGGMLILGSFRGQFAIPEIIDIFKGNPHPKGVSIFPYLFISIACGAVSGFHATQTPMIARCIKNETEGRKVFYGAMIAEGVVALIWAAAAMTVFGGIRELSTVGSPAVVVNKSSAQLLGGLGAFLAVLGVVACPITSGDTAFRGSRLIIADIFKIKQEPIKNRFLIAIPLFIAGIYLTTIDFNIIWRYFAWSNQTLATVALWTAAVWLLKNNRKYWIALFPAMFMTVVVVSYIVIAPEGFVRFFKNVPVKTIEMYGLIIAGIVTIICTTLFFMYKSNLHKVKNIAKIA